MNTEEQQPQADQQQQSESSISFTPEVVEQKGISYEQTQTREGIKPISSVDILDEEELSNYLLQLQSLSGSPEATEIYEIQKANLISNATNGVKQRRLTHREVYKEIQANNAKKEHQDKTKSYLDRVPFVKSIRSVYKNYIETKIAADARKNVNDNELMLAKHWRQIEHDLPTFDVIESKDERDRYYNFDTLYRQLILNLADFVGKLPASESNHHNWPGGLLKHSLEVASISFKYAKSWDLPPISLNDYEARRRPRWQYAAWVIGLFHDVGKAITDMVVVCEDAEGKVYRWNPMLNSLNEFCASHKIVRYYIDMNDASRYMNSAGRFKRHEGMASSLLDKLLTPESRHFLTSSPDPGFGLYEQVSSILSGKKGGDKYLMDALNRGEELSVHLSYKKIRSDFHLNNRNASVAELMMRELPYMLDYENFMKNVFVVSGYVMLRYPEALNQLKQAVINKSPETKAILNYSAIELGKQLSSSNFIRKVNANNFLPRFAPTKEVLKRDKVTREELITYERDSGFCPVVILEHATLLFGKNELPPSITGVLSLNMEHSLEFVGDGDVIEHIHERPVPESEEPQGADILDPEAKFKVVKQIKTQMTENDPDFTPGENTLELRKGEINTATHENKAAHAQQTVPNKQTYASAKQQTSNQATASSGASKPVQQTGASSSKATSPRQQAMKAAKDQASNKTLVKNANVDIYSLDQPPEVIEEVKVLDEPESLVKGVDSSKGEVPNKNNDRNWKNSILSQVGEVPPATDSTIVDTKEDSNNAGHRQTSDSIPNSEAVPLDLYSDMPQYDEEDGPDYSDIYSLPTELQHDSKPLLDSNRETLDAGGQPHRVGINTDTHKAIKPNVDVITELFAEWIAISANNRKLAEGRSIPFMLFKSPFFVDNVAKAGRADWAYNGSHVERRNKTTVKLKASFIDTVLAYLDGKDLPQTEFNLNQLEQTKSQVDSSTEDQAPSFINSGNPQTEPPAMESQVSECSTVDKKTNLTLTELKKQARTGVLQPTDGKPIPSEKVKVSPKSEITKPLTENTVSEQVGIAQDQASDNAADINCLVERLRNHVIGNLKIEPKFQKGLVPKPIFMSIIKGLGHSIEDAEAVGLVKKVDVRNYHINVDILYGHVDKISNDMDIAEDHHKTSPTSEDTLTPVINENESKDNVPHVDETKQDFVPDSASSNEDEHITSKSNLTYKQMKDGDVNPEKLKSHEDADESLSDTKQSISTPPADDSVAIRTSVHGVNTVQEVNPTNSKNDEVDDSDSNSALTDVHGVIREPEVDIQKETNDHQSSSLDDMLEAAVERAISRLDISTVKRPEEQAEFIKLEISCNKEGDYPNLDFMSLTILLAGKIKKGDVISVDPSRLNRDGTVDIMLSDFITQCVEYLNSKRSTFKIISKFDEDKLEQIATSLWVQNASTKNKITLKYTKD